MLEWIKKKFNKKDEEEQETPENISTEGETTEDEATSSDGKNIEENTVVEEADETIEREEKIVPEDAIEESEDAVETVDEVSDDETVEEIVPEDAVEEFGEETEISEEVDSEEKIVPEDAIEESEDVVETVDEVSDDESVEEIVPEDAVEESEELGEEIEVSEEVDSEEKIVPEDAIEESEDVVKTVDEVSDDESVEEIVPEDIIEEMEVDTDQDAEDSEDEKEKSEKKVGWFSRLKAGLSKTRDDMGYKINDILGNYVKIDDDMMEDLEDLLISSDIGMETTMLLIDNLRESIRKQQIKDPKEVRPLLVEEIRKILEKHEDRAKLQVEPSPAVILIVGVNGVGKTTTIGKLAYRFKQEGKSVMIAAADTFRAAAIEQVETWGKRSNTPVISHKEGADPAAVVYDALQAQKARKIDVLICDTAGRLHNKKNLMNELEKIHRIIEKESPDAQKESLLVLDATTGQNAILQAKSFDEVTQLTGIVLTKLDGTAKGGVVLPLIQELDIPIKLIGVGEGMEDLQDFSGKDFADALVNVEQ